MSKIPPLGTRLFGIYFTRTSVVNPTARRTTTTFQVGGITVATILLTLSAPLLPDNKLEYLGSVISKLNGKPKPKQEGQQLQSPGPVFETQFTMVLSNLGCSDIDLKDSMVRLQGLTWIDEDGSPLTAIPYLQDAELGQDQLLVLLNFRQKLPSCEYLQYQTLWMLNKKYTGTQHMDELLSDIGATDQGDETGSGIDDPQTDAWAKGLINRITTGGPNGSMAGNIAVNFMSNVTVPAVAFVKGKKDIFSAYDNTNPIVAIVQDAVSSAALSTSQGLAEYLSPKVSPSAARNTDKQIATVVKGIRDSMPSTGKSVAQLAVFNALGNDLIEQLPQTQQLRVAYTVANATRSAVEAVGNHVADLYQADSIPSDEELAAVGARSLGDFLASVGKTVASGVMQAAPVILNSIINSVNANNALGSTLPPEVMLSLGGGLQLLDVPTKITLASRIVNGNTNPDSNVITDKAVSDLANRTSTLGAQATIDTFTDTSTQPLQADDPATREKFRDVAVAVATLSPTISNVTDIGATNLVTDSSLKHADSLRQSALEVGMRSCANMIAENPSAEILYKVHLHRLKNGVEFKPRSFSDFLKSAVPIAANIAMTALPAVLSVL